MKTYKEQLSALDRLTNDIQGLKNNAYDQCSVLVSAVLDGQLTSEADIDRLMDHIANFGDEARFLDLYRTLLRHVYIHMPQMVGGYDALFRAQFITNDSRDSNDI